MDDWLAPLNLVESVEKYIEIFRTNGLVSPEDLYMSDFKIDDFLKMGITNENDRTAIYYAINPEELDSLANSVIVDEDDIDRQIREAEAQLQGTLIDLGKDGDAAVSEVTTSVSDLDQVDLEAQIAEAEKMMKALENEIQTSSMETQQPELTEEQVKAKEELEEKALEEKIRIEEEALKKLELNLKLKEEKEEKEERERIQQQEERINKEKLKQERENRELHALIQSDREKISRSESSQALDGSLVSLDGNNFLSSVAVKDGRMQSDYTYKIIIIGDSGVGKSNIINRWMSGTFSHDLPPTIQCAYSSKSFHVSNSYVDVQLWDTAGQERYVSLTRSFYRGAHGVVLVYDLCNRTTFQSLSRWIDTVSIELEINDTHFIVIGNKSDYADHREVSVEEGLNFSKSKKMFFLETSALDGSNINKALQILLQEIHNKYAVKLDTNPQSSDGSNPNLKSGVVLNQQKKDSDNCSC